MRSLKPVAVLAVLAAVLTIGAASALAAFQSGTYKGRTSQGRGLTFVVAPGKVRALSWSIVSRCASRATFRETGTSRNIPIRRGTFHRSAVFVFFTTKNGQPLRATAQVVMSGRSLSGGKARGTLGLAFVFSNTSGKRVDACSTGKIFWTAHK
jgi:hypothetical protein